MIISYLLETVIAKLLLLSVTKCSVIPWSSPVPGFGRIEEARIATLGINPSNLEFVDQAGSELTGAQRRFHTLHSLALKSWDKATPEDVRAIAYYCRSYFERNPYDAWFRPLDELTSGKGASYYPNLGFVRAACHLDLVPFATDPKWGRLPRQSQEELLRIGMETLGKLLANMTIDALILNGATVVQRLQEIGRLSLESSPMPDWDLPRKNGMAVRGIAFRGTLSELPGFRLPKPITILGYNHNLQSTYGITRSVRDALREWIRVQTAGV